MKIFKHITLSLLALCTFLTASAIDDVRLLRFPDINNDLIAFVYAGDIWTVSSSGGEARRLTSHEGLELFPKISPDGKWIAFSRESGGNTDIWIMEVASPTFAKPITLGPAIDTAPSWSPDGRHIVFESDRSGSS